MNGKSWSADPSSRNSSSKVVRRCDGSAVISSMRADTTAANSSRLRSSAGTAAAEGIFLPRVSIWRSNPAV